MSLLHFPLERRFAPGDRVRFVTEAGQGVTGTVMEPREDRPEEVRVWADEVGGFWRVPPDCLTRVGNEEVVLVEPPQSPMRRQMMRRVAGLYAQLDPEALMAKVTEGVELGRYANPRAGIEERRESIRKKLTYYFRALGRPIARDEAMKGGA